MIVEISATKKKMVEEKREQTFFSSFYLKYKPWIFPRWFVVVCGLWFGLMAEFYPSRPSGMSWFFVCVCVRAPTFDSDADESLKESLKESVQETISIILISISGLFRVDELCVNPPRVSSTYKNFHVGSTSVSRRFHVGFTAFPRRFHGGSTSVSRRFHVGSAAVPRGWRNIPQNKLETIKKEKSN